MLGLLFSLFEDVPNSVLTVIAFGTYHTQDSKSGSNLGIFVWEGSYKCTSQYNHNYSTITRVHRGGKLEVFGEKLPPCPPHWIEPCTYSYA